jgi:hypothetical protein
MARWPRKARGKLFHLDSRIRTRLGLAHQHGFDFGSAAATVAERARITGPFDVMARRARRGR